MNCEHGHPKNECLICMPSSEITNLSRADFDNLVRDAMKWRKYEAPGPCQCEYKGLYDALVKRTNALEHRMGQIAMILRQDMTDEPIRDF